MQQQTPSAAAVEMQPRQRDVRLDFFRGMGMFIILIAHITNNPWTLFIPARFGFSDATEMFVFCSGMASAIAFGAVFAKRGFFMGAFRVAVRVWEVYWVHIATFLVTLAAMAAINKTGWFVRDEVAALNLLPFFRPSGNQVIGLLSLTYVPNYFDILPMYLVILAMLPFVMALSRLHVWLAMGFSTALWLVATFTNLNIPAELWFVNNSQRQWYFNPFAWQLVFFTGFAFMSGWLPAPPRSKLLAAVAIGIVLLTIPFAWYVVIAKFEFIKTWRSDWRVLIDKTDFGLLRYVHFLALSYLAWLSVGPNGVHLSANPLLRAITRIFCQVGQQSLAVFASSIVLARILGAILNANGSSGFAALWINLSGFVLIYLVARVVAFAKAAPWKAEPAAVAVLESANHEPRQKPKLTVVN